MFAVACSGSAAAGPLAGGKGWEITSTLTAPLMADADTSRVQFGEHVTETSRVHFLLCSMLWLLKLSLLCDV